MPRARRRSPTARVPSGTNIWIQDAAPGTVTLSAAAEATVPTGNVYLYDGNSPGLADAQKLILAEEGVVRTDVQAQATLALPGSLTVTKTIGGAAAGQQGEIRIDVSCNGVGLDPVHHPGWDDWQHRARPTTTCWPARRARSRRPPTGRPRPQGW